MRVDGVSTIWNVVAAFVQLLYDSVESPAFPCIRLEFQNDILQGIGHSDFPPLRDCGFRREKPRRWYLAETGNFIEHRQFRHASAVILRNCEFAHAKSLAELFLTQVEAQPDGTYPPDLRRAVRSQRCIFMDPARYFQAEILVFITNTIVT